MTRVAREATLAGCIHCLTTLLILQPLEDSYANVDDLLSYLLSPSDSATGVIIGPITTFREGYE